MARIGYTTVHHIGKRKNKTTANEGQLVERQARSIELPVFQAVPYHFLHQGLYACRRGFVEAARSGLDGVGQRQDGHFAFMRLGPGISEVFFAWRRVFAGFRFPA